MLNPSQIADMKLSLGHQAAPKIEGILSGLTRELVTLKVRMGRTEL